MMRAVFSSKAYLGKMPRVMAIFALGTVVKRERAACDGTKGANFVWGKRKWMQVDGKN